MSDEHNHAICEAGIHDLVICPNRQCRNWVHDEEWEYDPVCCQCGTPLDNPVDPP
jgi:hypothetical protein